MSAVVIAAFSWLLDTNVVMRSLPLKRTTEPLTKLLPCTVRAKPASPAVAVFWERLVRLGARFLTVKSRRAEVLPPGVGLATVIAKTPAACRSARVIAAVNSVLLTKEVLRSLPLKRTTEPLKKLLP